MEPDPGYTFEPMGKYSMDRSTWQRGVKYYVDKPEWEASNIWQSVPDEKKGKKDMAMYSQKIRVFETGIENDYINRLRQEVCPPLPSEPVLTSSAIPLRCGNDSKFRMKLVSLV
jgi:hypothetical protein